MYEEVGIEDYEASWDDRPEPSQEVVPEVGSETSVQKQSNESATET